MFKRLLSQTRNPQGTIYLLCNLLLIVSGLLIFKASTSILLQGVGSSLIATGIAGWVIFVVILSEQSSRDSMAIVQRLGIVAGFTQRGAAIQDQYRDRVKRASHQIDVLGFGLSSLREDFRNDFHVWKRNASVRILLLDPNFPSQQFSYAAQRDSEENNPANAIADDVRQFGKETASLIDDRFQVKLYRCIPAVNIFRVDEELFWGPYLIGTASRNSPTIIVKSYGPLFSVFTSHFEEIWSKHSYPIGAHL
jgi:hypothetical protein